MSYINTAKRLLGEHGRLELCALGIALAPLVTVAGVHTYPGTKPPGLGPQRHWKYTCITRLSLAAVLSLYAQDTCAC